MTVELTVPERLAPDGAFEAAVSGLEPAQAVTLTASLVDPNGGTWRSAAAVVAVARGTARVGASGAGAGDDAVVDGNELLWSLAPDDVAAAETTGLGDTEPLEVEVAAAAGGREVARATVVVERLAPGVRSEPVRATGLYGELFIPPGDGPFRPVLTFGGSDGGLRTQTAAFLAAHGYLALAVAYFDAPGLPDELVDIEVAYFARALAFLGARPEAQGPAAVVGRSRGGELSLLLGLHLGVETVVAWVPSPIVHAGITKGMEGWLSDVPSWRVDGRPVPYLAHDDGELFWRDGAVVCTPTYLLSLGDWDRVRAAMLPLEECTSNVLLLSGADDQVWPSSVYGELAMAMLRRRRDGRQRHVVAPGAGHSFGHATVPSTLTVVRHEQGGERIDLGGSPRANAAGGRRAYAEMLRALAGDVDDEGWT